MFKVLKSFLVVFYLLSCLLGPAQAMELSVPAVQRTTLVGNGFGMLPAEVGVEIFNKMLIKERQKCLLVCKNWNRFLLENFDELYIPKIAFQSKDYATFEKYALAQALGTEPVTDDKKQSLGSWNLGMIHQTFKTYISQQALEAKPGTRVIDDMKQLLESWKCIYDLKVFEDAFIKRDIYSWLQGKTYNIEKDQFWIDSYGSSTHVVGNVIPLDFKREARKNVTLAANLIYFPPAMQEYTVIENLRLNLVTNELGKIVGLNRFQHLKKLTLGGDSLPVLQESLKYLTSLESLNLSYAQITTLPNNLPLLNLKTLDLSSNKLPNVPTYLGELTTLEDLNLEHNDLQGIPSWLEKLKRLTILKLGNNPISCLPQELATLENLQSLDFHGTEIEAIPLWIEQLRCLKELRVSATPIKRLPQSLMCLEEIELLDLSGLYQLEELPIWIGNLSRLTALNLSMSRSTPFKKDFLKELKNLNALQSLNLSYCNLEDLSPLLDSLPFGTLLIKDKVLQSLPMWLPNITKLNLGNNNIREIPDTLRLCQNLKKLNLKHNKITLVPYWMEDFKQGKEILLKGNPIKQIQTGREQLQQFAGTGPVWQWMGPQIKEHWIHLRNKLKQFEAQSYLSLSQQAGEISFVEEIVIKNPDKDHDIPDINLNEASATQQEELGFTEDSIVSSSSNHEKQPSQDNNIVDLGSIFNEQKTSEVDPKTPITPSLGTDTEPKDPTQVNNIPAAKFGWGRVVAGGTGIAGIFAFVKYWRNGAKTKSEPVHESTSESHSQLEKDTGVPVSA